MSVDIEFLDAIKDLQERLALAQLNEVRLREALLKTQDNLSHLIYHGMEQWAKDEANKAYELVEQALSAPPNRADLDAWVENQFGEPVAWMKQDGSVCSLAFKNDPPHAEYASLFTIPLYAKKG